MGSRVARAVVADKPTQSTAPVRVWFYRLTCRGCARTWTERFPTQEPNGPSYHVLKGVVCSVCRDGGWSLTDHGWEEETAKPRTRDSAA